MKKVILITALAFMSWQSAAVAQERSPLAMRITFEWSVAGTLAGTVIGFALWLTDPANPGNDLSRQMIEGAALGTVAGAAYGLYMLQANAQIPASFVYEPGAPASPRSFAQERPPGAGPGGGALAASGVPAGRPRFMVPLFNMRF